MERLKTVFLVSLVALSILLSGKIVVNKKLLDDYGFMSNMTSSAPLSFISSLNPFAKQDKNNSKALFTSPIQTIVNFGGEQRAFLRQTDNLYASFNSNCQAMFLSLFSSQAKPSSSDIDEIKSILKTRSFYINFSTMYDAKSFSQLLGLSETSISQYLNTFSDMIISLSDPIKNTVVVYIRDEKNSQFLKFDVNYPKSSFEQVIQGFTENNYKLISYSTELNYDKITSKEQKVLIDPLVPMFLEPISSNVIVSENPIYKLNMNFDTIMLNKILKIFNINPNSVRKYTEADQTLVFVENNATLKIHKEGIIEYNAKQGSTGLTVSRQGSSISTNILQVTDFIDSLLDATHIKQPFAISSNSIHGNSYSLGFAYNVNGVPVGYNYVLPSFATPITDAVKIELDNGSVKSYLHILRNYTLSNEMSPTPLTYQSIDNVFSQNRNNLSQISIPSIFLVYRDNGIVGNKKADWAVSIKER